MRVYECRTPRVSHAIAIRERAREGKFAVLTCGAGSAFELALVQDRAGTGINKVIKKGKNVLGG